LASMRFGWSSRVNSGLTNGWHIWRRKPSLSSGQ
jgi:hypothetical protein